MVKRLTKQETKVAMGVKGGGKVDHVGGSAG